MVFLRFPEIKFPHGFRIFRVFHTCQFGGRFWRFLRSGKILFFCVFLVWGLRGAVQKVVGRETLQNMGFRNNFALWYLVHLRWARCIASMLHTFFENAFGGLTNFYFRKFEFLTKLGGLEGKKRLGAAELRWF